MRKEVQLMYEIRYNGEYVGRDFFDKYEVIEELIRIKKKFGLGRIERANIDDTVGVLFIESK